MASCGSVAQRAVASALAVALAAASPSRPLATPSAPTAVAGLAPAEAAWQRFSVYFRQDSAELTEQAQAVVAAAAVAALASPETRVVAEGHADTLGSRWHNLRLSKMRTRSVSSALRQVGVPKARMLLRWSGETDLPHETEDGIYEPLNRTVTIILEAQGSEP